MSLDYILRLSDVRATLERVGGKGASLARLANAGLPVPEGFCVTTAAYQRFVAENNLQPQILHALQSVDVAQPTTLDSPSRTIVGLFAKLLMPEDIAAMIALAYNQLHGTDPAVAVRSSATAEDLPGLSFAGQQESFLNVRGVVAVQAAVKRCWASLWTPRAIGYRARYHIDHNVVSLAVVVQRLVDADTAGILFTAHPITGRRDRAVINAAWGLGEAVVGGAVTPDTFILDRATCRIIEQEIADKHVMTVPTERGTTRRPVPEKLRRTRTLTDEQATKLAQFGARIERLYGRPMDIEWALAAGDFSIVQARPITALPQ